MAAHGREPARPVLPGDDGGPPGARAADRSVSTHLWCHCPRVASLLGVLAALTLALASVEIYGVATNNVSARTREIGIRMALGARGSRVQRMIVREQLPLTLIGVAVGTGLGVVGSTLLASFLFGVTPTDGLTLGGASATLGLVSVAASYLPARRAARLDPLVALRRE